MANKIDDQLLQGLLDKVNELKISKKEVAYLEDELAQVKTLLYITDNCGEIVLDKIFLKLYVCILFSSVRLNFSVFFVPVSIKCRRYILSLQS